MKLGTVLSSSSSSNLSPQPVVLVVMMMAFLHPRSMIVRGFTAKPKRIPGIRVKQSGSDQIFSRQGVPFHSYLHFESCRRLFFRKTDVATSLPPREKVQPSTQVMDELQSSQFSIPYSITLEDELETTLTVRCMTREDFGEIVPMCIAEFGSGPTLSFTDFPLKNISTRSVSRWWEQVWFEPMVIMALTAKISANEGQVVPPFRDPAVLVLTRRDKMDPKPVVVGMVELSLQVPEATKNPPPFPTPLWIKSLYSQMTNRKLEGWITNLLIGDDFRGLGYSKILMAATEGIAKSWNVNSIFLHADADSNSGKVPQALYEGIGYQVIKSEVAQFAWMGDSFDNRVHIVEGVPLLYLYKTINEYRR